MGAFRQSLIPVAVGVLATAIGLSSASAISPAAPPGNAVQAVGLERTVTLITGDQVRASPDLRQVQFVPGPGRQNVRFSIRRTAGSVSVVPVDAARLIAADRLDRRLFDLQELLRYDDKRSTDLPLIVTYSGSAANGGAALRAAGGTNRPLAAINGAATRLPKAKAAGLYAELAANRRTTSAIKKIWLDGQRKPLLDQSTAQIGAPAAWAAGLTGRGVKVAVLDGGVDANHPDVKDRLTSADFTGEGLGDVDGHGTHVASTVAGTGAASDRKYRGVAPDADILDGKVCVLDGCSDSAILAGMDWAVQQGARIVNLSLGGWDSAGDDPLEQAVNNLSATHGTLFVIAAGNDGPGPGSLTSPGSAAAALTVGAVDRTDQLAEFSGRGPTDDGGPVKPDVTAPGVGIVAAKASTSSIGEPVGTSYLRLSGTSMATPHVAGAAALLAQQHPDWKGSQLKAALIGSAHEVSGVPMMAQGAGRVDVAAAIKLTVVASTASIGYDEQSWPHTDDKPQGKTVTYTNDGDQPAQLALEAGLTAPDGQPAPAAAVQLSASSLTVPAHGSAEVVITSNTNHAGPDGQYTGKLTARIASGGALTTTLAVRREVESYTLTVRHLDRTGAETSDYSDTLVDRDASDERDNSQVYLGADGNEYRVRIPKGRYLLESWLGTAPDRKETTDLVLPQLDLTADRTVTLDARQAKPVKISVQDQRAHHDFTIVAFELVTPLFTYGGGIGGGSDLALFTGQVGPTVPGLTGNLHSEFVSGTPDPDGGYTDSPVVYQLSWSTLNGTFSGFTKAVRDSELATLRPTITAGAGQTEASWRAQRMSPRIGIDLISAHRYTKLPATPTIRMTVADDFRWQPGVRYYGDGSRASFVKSAVTCRPGRTCADTWGNAVLTPVVADARIRKFQSLDTINLTELSRTADTVSLSAAGADGSGHFAFPTGTFTLTRDGGTPTEVPNDGQSTANVPAAEAPYRLDLTTEGSPLGVSTKTVTSWQFKSKTTTAKTPLPLWTINYHPPVGNLLPFTLKSLPGAKVGSLTTVTLQTSTDEGKTWHPAKVRSTAQNRYVAAVTTAAAAKSVSLRATATDTDGNTITQQIDHAYNLTP